MFASFSFLVSSTTIFGFLRMDCARFWKFRVQKCCLFVTTHIACKRALDRHKNKKLVLINKPATYLSSAMSIEREDADKTTPFSVMGSFFSLMADLKTERRNTDIPRSSKTQTQETSKNQPEQKTEAMSCKQQFRDFVVSIIFSRKVDCDVSKRCYFKITQNC